VATISITEFRRYVEPFATGVTPFEIYHNTRETLRDFCTRTKCWQVLLSPVLSTVGTPEYTLVPPTGAIISQVEEVFFCSDVVGFTGMDDLAGYFATNWRTMTAGPVVKATFIEPDILRLHYPPDSASNIYVRAAMKPSAVAKLIDSTIPAFIFEHWAAEIANGILARFYATPDKPFTNFKLSVERTLRYEQSVATAKLRVARSFGRQELETLPQFY
jgi:hypothetical protein